MRIVLAAADRSRADILAAALCAAGHQVTFPGGRVPSADGHSAAALVVDGFAPGCEHFDSQAPRPWHQWLVLGAATGADTGWMIDLAPDHVYPEGDAAALLLGLELLAARRAAPASANAGAQLEQANDTIYTVDFEGRFLTANAAAETLTGYPRTELIGMSIGELLLPEYVGPTRTEMAAKVSGEKASTFFEVEIRHADGRPRRVEISSRLLMEAGIPVAIQGIARDISNRQAAELQARFHAGLLDSITFPAIALDVHGVVVYWNAAATQAFGYSAGEVLNQHALETIVAPADRDVSETWFDSSMERGDLRGELRLMRKDRTTFPVRISGSLLRDDAGTAIGAMALLFDLSVQEASEERYRAALEQSLDGFFIFTAERDATGEVVDFRFVDMNAEAERLVSLTIDEAAGELLCELLPVNRTGGFFAKYKTVVETGEPVDEEFAIDTRGINASWLHITVVKLGDGVAITSRDISARKFHQEELDRARRDLDAIFESTHEAVMTLTPDLRLLTFNKAVVDLGVARAGRAPQRGDPIHTWVSDHQWELFQSVCRNALDGKRFTAEIPYPTSDGRTPWFEFSFAPMRGEHGEIEAISIVARDVSERRSAEHALAEREASLRAVFESMTEALTLLDRSGRLLMANPLALERGRLITGRDPQPGDDMTEFALPQHRASFSQYLERAFAGEHITFDSYFQMAGDDRPSWTEYHYHPVRDNSGEVVAVSRVSRDITARKVAEAELERATMYQRAVIENVADALFVLDIEGDGESAVYRAALVNSAFERLTGLRQAAIVGLTAREFMPPDSAEQALKRYEQAIAAGQTITYLEQIPYGSRPTIQTSLSPIFDAAGRCYRIVGSSRDLSELYRLQAEERAARERAEVLALIVESAGDSIIRLDLEERITFWNPAAERIYGWSAEEALGQHISLIWDTDATLEGEPALQRVQRVYAGETITHAVARRRRKDGSAVDVQVSVFPLRDLEGRTVAIGSTASDITDRLRAEAEMRTKVAHLDAVFAGTRDQLTLLDRDGQFLAMNQRATEAFAILWDGRIPALGDSCRDWVHPDDRATFDQSLGRVLRGESFEFESKLEIGEGVWLDHGWSPVRLDDGSVGGAVVVVRDISQKKRTNEALMQAQKLESLGVLAGGIAHDFNNLLVGILGNAGLALMEISPTSPARETLEAIETAGQRAAELARQMLAYSGKGKFVVQEVDLSELVDEMLHLLRVSIGKGVDLHVSLPRGLPPVVADATQLRQVVMNLVVNASDAIGERNGVVAIQLTLETMTADILRRQFLAPDLPAGRYLRLEVRDSGSGMDAETLKRIFDPFFTTKFTGRGLGLASVLGIVKGHQGAIHVESTPGEGTTFHVLLPAMAEAEVVPETAEVAAPWRGSGLILVVDDEHTVRAVTARALRAFGFETLEAGDGIEGLEVYERYRDEVTGVVLDMTMPRMNGEELFARIRERDPRARVVLMSGFSEQDAGSRFEGLGLSAFIQKPFEMATLRDTIRRMIEGDAPA